MLIAMAGLPGSGKSTLARALAAALPAIALDKDQVRQALFPPETIEYSAAQDDLCVGVMLDVAAFLLARAPQRPIILDGRTWTRHAHVAALIERARQLGTALRMIECRCADATVRARLEHDAAAGRHVARNRDYALYLALQARAEPITMSRLVVDTDQPLSDCVARCLAYLRADQPSDPAAAAAD